MFQLQQVWTYGEEMLVEEERMRNEKMFQM